MNMTNEQKLAYRKRHHKVYTMHDINGACLIGFCTGIIITLTLMRFMGV